MAKYTEAKKDAGKVAEIVEMIHAVSVAMLAAARIPDGGSADDLTRYRVTDTAVRRDMEGRGMTAPPLPWVRGVFREILADDAARACGEIRNDAGKLMQREGPRMSRGCEVSTRTGERRPQSFIVDRDVASAKGIVSRGASLADITGAEVQAAATRRASKLSALAKDILAGNVEAEEVA